MRSTHENSFDGLRRHGKGSGVGADENFGLDRDGLFR